MQDHRRLSDAALSKTHGPAGPATAGRWTSAAAVRERVHPTPRRRDRAFGLRLAAVRPDWELVPVNGDRLVTPDHQRVVPAGDITAVSYRAELQPSGREIVSHLLDRDASVVSRYRITGGRPVDEVEAAGAVDAAWSMDSAIAAAAAFLGHDVNETGTGAVVEAVGDDRAPARRPSTGARAGLQLEDVIVEVDGRPVRTAADLRAVLRGRTSAELTVERGADGLRRVRTSTVPVQRDRNGNWGIRVITADRALRHDLAAHFALPEDLRGPSLGLACALSVVDAFTGGRLASGGDVVATGTVDLTGRIGEVGAVLYKARAVRAQGNVRRFLVPASPASDVADARRVLAGRVEVVAVSNLAEAVQVLRANS